MDCLKFPLVWPPLRPNLTRLIVFPFSYLRASSVLTLVESLSKLLVTALPGHTPNREVGLFPIVALQEVGVANVDRLDVIWEPITSHLSQVQS